MGEKDSKEVKEILDVVSDKVPKLLNDISDALFNVEKAEKFGLTVANFYKSMKESGMSDEQAFELTQKFMESQSMGSIVQQAIGGATGGGGEHKHHSGKNINIQIGNGKKKHVHDEECCSDEDED